jgi:hypothetical protein
VCLSGDGSNVRPKPDARLVHSYTIHPRKLTEVVALFQQKSLEIVGGQELGIDCCCGLATSSCGSVELDLWQCGGRAARSQDML